MPHKIESKKNERERERKFKTGQTQEVPLLYRKNFVFIFN